MAKTMETKPATKPVMLTFPMDLYEDLRELSVRNERTVSQQIRVLVREAIEDSDE